MVLGRASAPFPLRPWINDVNPSQCDILLFHCVALPSCNVWMLFP